MAYNFSNKILPKMEMIDQKLANERIFGTSYLNKFGKKSIKQNLCISLYYFINNYFRIIIKQNSSF